MERQLRARLGAAKIALADKEGEDRRLISKAQVAAVQALCGREPGLPGVLPEARAGLVDFASATNWHSGDLEKVLTCLQAAEKIVHQRRPMQQFAPGLLGYFTPDEWDSMQFNATKNSEVPQAIVFRRAALLSGRNLSEPSLKLLSSFLLYLAHGQSASWIANDTKKRFYEQVKRSFKTFVRKHGDPQPYIEVLPNHPDELKERHPQFFDKIYPSQQPTPCRVPLKELMQVDSSYSCRGGGSGGPVVGGFGSVGGDSIVHILLQQMAALQQVRTSESSDGGIVMHGGLRSGKPLKSLAALAQPTTPSSLPRLMSLPSLSTLQEDSLEAPTQSSPEAHHPPSAPVAQPPAARPMLLPPALLPPQDGLLSEDTAPATEHRLAEDAAAAAHRVTEAPVAHRPAEDAAADAHGTTDVLAVANTMMMHSEAMTPANAHRPAEDAIVQAHRDAEAPVAANATAHRNAEAPVAANATGDAVVPVRSKALDMLTDFVDMQEERAQRKRASNKEGSEQQPKAKAAKKEADAKSAGKQLKEATEAAPKTKAKAASKTSAKACTAPLRRRRRSTTNLQCRTKHLDASSWLAVVLLEEDPLRPSSMIRTTQQRRPKLKRMRSRGSHSSSPDLESEPECY